MSVSPTTTDPPPLKFSYSPVIITVVSVLVVLAFLAYNLHQKKMSMQPILRQKNFEPIIASNIIDNNLLRLYRTFIAVWITVIYLWCIVTGNSSLFSFYTVWNYTLLWLYFLNAAIFSWVHYLSRDGISQSKSANLWRLLIWILFQIECCLALLVDIVVWTVLFPTGDHDDRNELVAFESINMHILNAIFLYSDFMFNQIPIRILYGVCPLIVALVYVFWSWVYYGAFQKWDYFFLDTSKEINGFWYALVCLIHVVCWIFAYYLGQWRDKQWKEPIKTRLLSVNGADDETVKVDIYADTNISLQPSVSSDT